MELKQKSFAVILFAIVQVSFERKLSISRNLRKKLKLFDNF